MYSQPIVVKQDPRVKTPALAMQQVYTLSKATYYETLAAAEALDAARKANDQDEVKSLSDVLTQLGGVLNVLQEADVPATAVQLKAIADARQKAAAALAKSKRPH
jgi:hypothetical protein